LHIEGQKFITIIKKYIFIKLASIIWLINYVNIVEEMTY